MDINNSAPFEIIGAPYELYRAPLGTPFPKVDEVPAAPWARIGTSGNLNQNADGVKVQMSQSFNKFRGGGDTGTRKIFRTEEDLIVSVSLADLSVEALSNALNDNTIETVAAGNTAGTKAIGLSRGTFVATMALLVRGASPYMEDGIAQYEIPYAAQTGNSDTAYKNGDAALLGLEFSALIDPTAPVAERYGRYVAQTDHANS